MEKTQPKWQREFEAFIGIKTGIILEGNVNDLFVCEQDGILYSGDLDDVIQSRAEKNNMKTIFFDPLSGFYSDDIDLKKVLGKECDDGTCFCYGTRIGYFPERRNDASVSSTYVKAGEWIRSLMTGQSITPKKNGRTSDDDNPDNSGKDSVLLNEPLCIVVKFSARLNLRNADSEKLFLNLVQASLAIQRNSMNNSTLVLVTDNFTDIPVWVYLNNPSFRTISISIPEREDKAEFLRIQRKELQRYTSLGEEGNEAGKIFIAETDGMRLKELEQILKLGMRKGFEPEEIGKAVHLFKYGIDDDPWAKLGNDILIDLRKEFENRIRGQEDALKKAETVIRRAVKGLSGLQCSGVSHKPKGILFFAGPSGVGKTETAKAIAKVIFGDENSMIRFDMSEFKQEHSDQNLFGAPPGYVGYEGGGRLTNAIRHKPFSVLLFDEIDKAAPSILDKFLQIMEDGRMTDGQGNTVYFGDCIIIFTSNIGLTEVDEDDPVSRYDPTHARKKPKYPIVNPEEEDSEEFKSVVYSGIKEGVKDYFINIGRPELLNRLGENNIIVYQYIGKKEVLEIYELTLKRIRDNLVKTKNLSLFVDGEADRYLRKKAVLERAYGGRGVGNMLERELVNPLTDYLDDRKDTPPCLTCVFHNGTIGFLEGVMDD